MNLIRIATAATLAVLSVGAASAQTQTSQKPLLIGTGSETGTYFRLVNEMKAACDKLQLEQWRGEDGKTSSGANNNIDLILNNKAALGIVQSDALEFRSQKEEAIRKNIFTLMVLHPEEVHVITKSIPHKEGGYSAMGMSIGGKQVVYSTVGDLKGRKVGYWGGSAITVQMINIVGLIGFEAVESQGQMEALSALANDDVDAVLAVGGQPLGWVEKLSRDYKVLEFSDSLVKQVSQVYDKTTLTYRNLGQEGVQTVSVNALMVTRNYTSKTAIQKVLDVKQCIVDHIDDIRDTQDTHPKWQVIDPNKVSRWPMFVPATTAGASKG